MKHDSAVETPEQSAQPSAPLIEQKSPSLSQLPSAELIENQAPFVLPKALVDVSQDEKEYAELKKLLEPGVLSTEIPVLLTDRAFHFKIFAKPVAVPSGESEEKQHIFEEECILEHLEFKDTNPLSGDKIKKKTSYPTSMLIKEMVEKFLNDHPDVRNSTALYMPRSWLVKLEEDCKKGDIASIQKLCSIDQGDPRLLSWRLDFFQFTKPGEKHWQGKRILHLACEQDTLNAVIELVRLAEKRAKGLGLLLLLQEDNAGRLPIHYTMLSGRDPHLMRYLAALMGKDLAKVTPLRVDPSSVTADVQIKRYVTALHLAAMNNQIEALEILLKARPNLEVQNAMGDTALHVAARYGAVDAIRLLVNAGASMDAENDEEQIPLSCASESAKPVLETLLREQEIQCLAAGPIGLGLLNTRRLKERWRAEAVQARQHAKEIAQKLAIQESALTEIKTTSAESQAHHQTQTGFLERKLNFSSENPNALTKWEHADPFNSGKTLRRTAIDERHKNPLLREMHVKFIDSKEKGNAYQKERELVKPNPKKCHPTLLAQSDDFFLSASHELRFWDKVNAADGTPISTLAVRDSNRTAHQEFFYLIYIKDEKQREKETRQFIKKIDLVGERASLLIRTQTKLYFTRFSNDSLGFEHEQRDGRYAFQPEMEITMKGDSKLQTMEALINQLDYRPNKTGYVSLYDKRDNYDLLDLLTNNTNFTYTRVPIQHDSYNRCNFTNCSALAVLSNGYAVISLNRGDPSYNEDNNNYLEVWNLAKKRVSHYLPRNGCVDALLPLSEGRFVEVRSYKYNKEISSSVCITSETESKNILFYKHVRSLGRLSDNEIIIGLSNNNLSVYNILDSSIRTLEGHTSPVTAIAVSKNGFIISGSEKGSLRVWDAKTGKWTLQLSAHSKLWGDNTVNAIVCTDDNRVISASNDGTVQIHDLDKRGAHIATLEHKSPVKSVILRNGKIMTSAADGSIQCWHDYAVKSIKVDLQFESKLVSANAQVTVVKNQLVITTNNKEPCAKELKDCGVALLALCPDHPQLTVTLIPNKLTISNIPDGDLSADLLDLCVTFGVHKQEQLKSNSFNGAVHLSISTSLTTSTPSAHVAGGAPSKSQCTPY